MANIPKIYINRDFNTQLSFLLNDLQTYLKVPKNLTNYSDLLVYPDIHIINRHEEKKNKSFQIGIDQIKQLQKELFFYPLTFTYQTGIIFFAQDLTTEAQNSMLKMLEEVKSHTLLYLLVDNEKNILKTVLSRCQLIYCNTNSSSSICNTNSNNNDEKSDEITTFINSNIVEKFLFIDKLVAEDKEQNNKIDDFLSNLLLYHKNFIELETKDLKKSQEHINRIKSIQIAQYRIKVNANKKSSLKNMALSIN